MGKIAVISFRFGLTLCFLLLLGCQPIKIEPVELVPEDICGYCKMAISEKRYAAELVNSEGEAFKFDDIGCLINFVKRGGAKGATYFVMDFNDREWIKADDAYYVSSTEFRTPMNGQLVAFRNQEKAQQAVDQYHGKLLRFNEVLVF